MATHGKHFDSSELSCHCCGTFPPGGIDDQIVAMLDNLREMMGGPLFVSCAYRCPSHNAEVGGVPNSQHVLGTAVDILQPDYLTFGQFLWYIMHNGVIDPQYLGIGTYEDSGFIHVDHRGYAARWDEND